MSTVTATVSMAGSAVETSVVVSNVSKTTTQSNGISSRPVSRNCCDTLPETEKEVPDVCNGFNSTNNDNDDVQTVAKNIGVDQNNDVDGEDCIDNEDDDDFDCRSDGTVSDIDPVDFSTSGCDVGGARLDDGRRTPVESSSDSVVRRHEQVEEAFRQQQMSATSHTVSQYHSIQQLSSPASAAAAAAAAAFGCHPTNNCSDGVYGATGLSARGMTYDFAAVELFRKAAVDSVLRGMMQHHAAAVGFANAAVVAGRDTTGDSFNRTYDSEEYGRRATSPDDVDEDWNGSGTSGNALSGDEMESDVDGDDGGRVDGSCSNRGSVSPLYSSGAAPDFDVESMAENEETSFEAEFNAAEETKIAQRAAESKTTSDSSFRGRRAWHDDIENEHGRSDDGRDPVEVKRARMENIVSSMRRSSSPHVSAAATSDTDNFRTTGMLKKNLDDGDKKDSERDRWISSTTKNAVETYFLPQRNEEEQQQQQQQKSNNDDQKVRSKRKQYTPKQHDVSSVRCDITDDCDDEGQQRTTTTTAPEVDRREGADRKVMSEERGALLAELHRMYEQLAEIKYKYATLYGDGDVNSGDEDQNYSPNRKSDGPYRRFGDLVADSWFRAQIINNPGFYGLYNGKNINNNNELSRDSSNIEEMTSTDWRRKFIDRMSETTAVGRVTGSQTCPLGGETPLSLDVDRIAGMLKAELACGVGSLVDEIVRNFVEKYRLSSGVGGDRLSTLKKPISGGKHDDDKSGRERKPWKKAEPAIVVDRKDSGSAHLERGEKMGASTAVENLSKDVFSQRHPSAKREVGQPSNSSTHYPGQNQFPFPLYGSSSGAAIGLPFLSMQSSLLPAAIRNVSNLIGSPSDILFGGGPKINSNDVNSIESSVKVPSSSFFESLHQTHHSTDTPESHSKQIAQNLHKITSFDVPQNGNVAAAAAAAAFAHQAGLYHQAASIFGSQTATGLSATVASSMPAPHAAYFSPRVPPNVFPNSAAAAAAATMHQAAAIFSSSSSGAAAASTSSTTPCREPEQTEALPLVVNSSSTSTQQSSPSSVVQLHQHQTSSSDVTPIVPKKKRTKVTDTRLSPRAARSILHHQHTSESTSHLRHLQQAHHHRSTGDGHGSYHQHHHQSGRHHHGGHGSGYLERVSRRIDDDGFDRHRNHSSPVSSGTSRLAHSVNVGRHFTAGLSPSATRHQFGGSATSMPPQQPDSPSSTSSTSALLPVSLPTSVAVPNPSLQHSDIMQSLFQFGQHHRGNSSATQLPTGFGSMPDDAPPLSSLLQRQASSSSTPSRYSMGGPFDFKSQLSANDGGSSDDAACIPTSGSSGSLGEVSYHHGVSGRPGSLPLRSKALNSDNGYDQLVYNEEGLTSTLTPMHLRKAKLMFFYVRYPSSAILKVYFPDVRFNKNNTAQLIKWFSNFREFYYIQMEKYARQALAEGVKVSSDLIVTTDSELYRVLVLHYNRNNQLEVPDSFRTTVQATLREFFKSIQAEKDQEQSWKKAIYKIIARLDDVVPEYFKSPNWMDQLAESTVTSGALVVGNGSLAASSDVKPYSVNHHMA